MLTPHQIRTVKHVRAVYVSYDFPWKKGQIIPVQSDGDWSYIRLADALGSRLYLRNYTSMFDGVSIPVLHERRP